MYLRVFWSLTLALRAVLGSNYDWINSGTPGAFNSIVDKQTAAGFGDVAPTIDTDGTVTGVVGAVVPPALGGSGRRHVPERFDARFS